MICEMKQQLRSSTRGRSLQKAIGHCSTKQPTAQGLLCNYFGLGGKESRKKWGEVADLVSVSDF
jgi:hypothetical protein